MRKVSASFSKIICLVVTALAFQLFSLHAHAEEILFVTDSSDCTQIDDCGKDRGGYIVDIVNAIFNSEQYSAVVKFVPWNRALAMVNDGRATGIIGTTKKSAPDLIYPKTEVAQYLPAIFTLKANPWHYAGVDSLTNVRLGLIQNYGYADGNPKLGKYLESKDAKIAWVTDTEPLINLFKLIEAGRIDATIDDESIGLMLLQKSGMQGKFKVAGYLEQGAIPCYVAFTPKDQKSQRLADFFDHGMATLRKSGKLKKILATYGLTDWEK